MCASGMKRQRGGRSPVKRGCPARQTSEEPPHSGNSGGVTIDAAASGEHEHRLTQSVPAWLRKTEGEARFPVVIAILAAIALQMLLPDRLAARPKWLLPILELALLVGLSVFNPLRLTKSHPLARLASLVMTALMTIANGISAGLLIHSILNGHGSGDATALLGSGAAIYLTNVVAFALWYWEIDRGGPISRADAKDPHPDFLFPQMASPEIASPDWEPTFIDYLYVSFTNATAFSPTDTLPLSRFAKGLMAAQSAIALSAVALVIARAINVLH